MTANKEILHNKGRTSNNEFEDCGTYNWK